MIAIYKARMSNRAGIWKLLRKDKSYSLIFINKVLLNPAILTFTQMSN